MTDATTPPSPPTKRPVRHAVIVGGGPSGLGTALEMRQKQLADRITVLERVEANTLPSVPSRQYAVQLRSTAVQLMHEIPGMLDCMKKKALPVYPCNSHIFKLNGDEIEGPFRLFNVKEERYWIRRNGILEAFGEVLETCGDDTPVELVMGVSCSDVKFKKGADVEVWYEDASGNLSVLHADLVIGADGARSKVRKCLQREFSNGHIEANGSGGNFDMQKWTSPSVGLVYKSLHLPESKFVKRDTANGKGREVSMESNVIYVWPGQPRRGKYAKFSAVFLPIGFPESFGRLGTIVTKPDHPLTTATDVEQVYEILEEAMPMIDVRASFSEDRIAEFVNVGTPRFPMIQRCGSLVAHFEHNAVALVGDALHSFPPDLGLGATFGIGDGKVLCAAIADAGLHDGVDRYEAERDDEVSALMRFHVETAPYQYRQNMLGFYRDLGNQLLRDALYEMLPSVFSPSFSRLTRRPGMKYAEALRLTDATTRRIYGSLATLVAVVAVMIAKYS